MQTIGWIIAIVLAIMLAFALYRPQVIKTPVAARKSSYASDKDAQKEPDDQP